MRRSVGLLEGVELCVLLGLLTGEVVEAGEQVHLVVAEGVDEGDHPGDVVAGKLPTLCMSVTRWLISHARCWGAAPGGASMASAVPAIRNSSRTTARSPLAGQAESGFGSRFGL